MKRFLSAIILALVVLSMFTIPVFAEDTDPMTAFTEFLNSHGTTGVYSAALGGGGEFSMYEGSDGGIRCTISQYENIEDYREGFDFTIVINDKFDGNYEWRCNTEDGNGTTKSKGTMTAGENCNSVINCSEYTGDAYIQNSILENAANFRNDLVRAIANDLNYYFDENLDFFGFNPQFLCPDGHAFGEWVYQKNAKLNVNGTEKRQCTTCFATEEREKEGSMLTVQPGGSTDVPAQTTQPTPVPETETTPETTPEVQTPVTTPEPEPEVEYQFEHELDDGEDDGEEEKKQPLPPYAIPLIIGIVAVVAVGVVVFIVISKRTKAEPEQESDVFSDDDF